MLFQSPKFLCWCFSDWLRRNAARVVEFQCIIDKHLTQSIPQICELLAFPHAKPPARITASEQAKQLLACFDVSVIDVDFVNQL